MCGRGEIFDVGLRGTTSGRSSLSCLVSFQSVFPQLKASTATLSNTLEAESENMVNRLHRQLRVVEAQLAAVQQGAVGSGNGSGSSNGGVGERFCRTTI